MKQLYTTILLLFLCSGLFAQIPTSINTGPEKKFKPNTSSLPPVVRLPEIDITALRKEDEIDNKNGLPPRFGKDIDVNFNLENSGAWENTKGGRVWKLEIFSENAFSLNLIFGQFELSEGAELYLYNKDRSMVVGPITSEVNNQRKKFATDLIRGESMILELFEPDTSKGRSTLNVKKVIHGYIDILSGAFFGYGTSEDCNNDINCQVGTPWQDESDAVAMILLANNTRHCTGALLNNTCQDFTPNLLTAFHCIDLVRDGVLSGAEINNAESWVFRFQYKSPTCEGPDNFTYFTYSGSTFRAGLFETDFALLELDTRPSLSSGVAYAGWSRVANAPTSSAGIHHPAGDVMKISIDNNAAVSIGFSGIANRMWQVGFDDGVVQHGSSGSPLFDQNRRVVGQLFGNQGYNNLLPYCDQPRGDYGRLDVSWGLDNGGGFLPGRNAANSLGNWLDPQNTGVMTTNTLNVSVDVPDLLCSPGTYTLQNLPAGSTATWSVTPSGQFTGPTSGSGITATLTPSSTAAAQAILTYTITTPCGNTQLQRVFWVGKPATPIIYPQDVHMDFPPNRFTVYMNSPAIQGVTSYNWYLDGVMQSSHTSSAVFNRRSPFCGRTYYVEVEAINACGTSVKGYYYVSEPSCFTSYSLKISPNPATSEVEIAVLGKPNTMESKDSEQQEQLIEDETGELVLYDRLGNQLYQQKLQGGKTIIDVRNLKPGTYVVKYNSPEGVLEGKLLRP